MPEQYDLLRHGGGKTFLECLWSKIWASTKRQQYWDILEITTLPDAIGIVIDYNLTLLPFKTIEWSHTHLSEIFKRFIKHFLTSVSFNSKNVLLNSDYSRMELMVFVVFEQNYDKRYSIERLPILTSGLKCLRLHSQICNLSKTTCICGMFADEIILTSKLQLRK